MRSWWKCSIKRRTFRVFPSNYIELRSVVLKRRQTCTFVSTPVKSEVNRFAKCHGKAQPKDNIRARMVRYQTVNSGHVIANLIVQRMD